MLLSIVLFASLLSYGTAFSQQATWEETIAQCRDARVISDADAAVDSAKRALELAGNDTMRQAISWNEAGLVALQIKKPDEAIKHFERAIELWTAIGQERAADLVASMENLGIALFLNGQHQNAADQFQAVVMSVEESFGKNDPRMIRGLQRIADCEAKLGRPNDAAVSWSRIASIQKATYGADGIQVAQSNDVAAAYWQAAGNLDQSVVLLKESLRIRESVLGKYHLEVVNSLHRLGEAMARDQQYELAIQLFDEALARAEQTLGPDTSDVLTSVLALLNACEKAGKVDRVVELKRVSERLKKMLDWYQAFSNVSANPPRDRDLLLNQLQKDARQFGEPSRPVVAMEYRRAEIHASNGDLEAAIDLCLQAIEHERQLFGDRHSKVGSGYYIVAGYYAQRENYLAAIDSLRKARSANSESVVPNRIQQQNYAYELAVLLAAVDEVAAADSLLSEAIQTRRELGLETGDRDADILNRIGVCQMRMSNPSEAIIYFQGALELFASTRTTDDPMLQTVRSNITVAQTALRSPNELAAEEPNGAISTATDELDQSSGEGGDLIGMIFFCLCGAYYSHKRGYSPWIWILLTAGAGIVIAL